MLEFNVDRQGGIKLHTCERKTRWCKLLLTLSWLLFLGFSGWLFFKGYLFNGYISFDPVSIGNKRSLVDNDCPDLSGTLIKEKEITDRLNQECDQKLKSLSDKFSRDIVSKSPEEHKSQINTLMLQLKQAEEKLNQSELALQKISLQNKNLKSSDTIPDRVSQTELSKKIYFYEEILGINSQKDAVSLNHFAMKQKDKKSDYRFQLVLARLGKHKTITGKYEIFFRGYKTDSQKKDNGNQEGNTKGGVEDTNKQSDLDKEKQSVSYKHTDLLITDDSSAKSGKDTFSFDYFQNLQGNIELPENFELESVSISVFPKGLDTLRNSYEWKDLKKTSFKAYKEAL